MKAIATNLYMVKAGYDLCLVVEYDGHRANGNVKIAKNVNNASSLIT